MKISVVIPSYNYAHWLPESIQSALNQTFKPHEVIVVDDGSKDNTREVAARYPVRYVYQTNAGPSAARNKGIEVATGDWIALLDADDYWLPEKLEKQAAAVTEEGFCYCASTRFFNDGHREEPEYHDAKEAAPVLHHHNFIDTSSVIVKRDLLLQVGGFNRNMPAGEDWEMWLKLLRVCKFASIPDRLLMYRVTGSSISTNPEIHLRAMEYLVAAGTEGLPPLRRWVESQRMRSTRYIQAAIKYRENRDYRNSLHYAWRALRAWPSPFYDKAYKVFLLEVRNYLVGDRRGEPTTAAEKRK